MKKLAVSLAAIFAVVGVAAAATYTVKSGDTMVKIAKAHGMEFATLRDLNPQVKDPTRIFPGQKLNLADGTATATKTAKTTVAKTTTTAKKAVADTKSTAKTTAKTVAAPVAVAPVAAKAPCPECDNVINGNPLYRPAAGHMYSVTDLTTDSGFKPWTLGEEFGVGITDSWSVFLKTALGTSDSFKSGTFAWDNIGLGTSLRYLDSGNWKADVYGSLTVAPIYDGTNWISQATSAYLWNVGTKFGYSTCDWTLNGLVEYNYMNSEAFNWNEVGLKSYTVGIEGQYVLTSAWNLVASLRYIMPDNSVANVLNGQFGVNYNFTANTFLGAYVFDNLSTDTGKFVGANGNADNFGLGLKFGVDF